MQNVNQPKTKWELSKPKGKAVILGLLLLLIAIISVFSFNLFNIPHSSQSTIIVGGIEVTVEIANEPSERTQGLSGRAHLKEDRGMLFVFDKPLLPSFWMQNMQFPIDIIWINQDGEITGIEESVAPETYPQTFSPDEPVKYVLEVNAGFSAENSISVGDKATFNF